MKKIITIVIVIIAVAAIILKAKGLLESRKASIENEPLPSSNTIMVPTVKAKQGMMQNIESYLAQVSSDKSIKLSTKLAGYVTKVYVQESQKVTKGDKLLDIDDTELLSNIQALRATLATQKADAQVAQNIYARNIKLYNIGGLAKEKLDISRVATESKSSIIENTKQKIAQLDHQLSYLKLVAPFDGEIDSILLHDGDLAAAGKPILSMSNGGKKLLFSFAPSSGHIERNQEVLLDSKKIGNIKSIYSTSSNGLTTAEIELTTPLNQTIGSSIDIDVVTKESNGCTVPSNTILHKKDGTYVMLYKDERFSPQQVQIEMSNEQNYLISPCPTLPIASASEVKLATLPAYDNVQIQEVSND